MPEKRSDLQDRLDREAAEAAEESLYGASLEELLRTAYRITHTMHGMREGVRQDLRDQRDLIDAEIKRRIEGEPVVEPEPSDDEVKYMIECNGCGEVFDDIQAAAAHKGNDDLNEECIQFTPTGMIRSSVLFSLVREDEAF